MTLSSRAWVLIGLVAVALLGLVGPGIAGHLGTYAWLGVFPGLALVRLLMPEAPAPTRWTLALLLSPLAAALAGWALIGQGMTLQGASRAVGLASWLLYAVGEARGGPRPEPSASDPPTSRFIVGLSIAAMLYCALPVTLDPWLRARSDGWVHGALVWEIHEHGIPPMDPRFIGLQLNYVWFYNLFTAMVTSMRGHDPFVTMAIMNTVDAGLLVWLAWLASWTLWGEARAARWSVAAVLLGLNAGAWLLGPLRLLRAWTGENRGFAEALRLAQQGDWSSTQVLYQVSAPFAHMVSFWDKFMLGTPLGYAYLFVLLQVWALGRAWRGDGMRWTVLLAVASLGMMLFHSVVGLSVVPVTLGALGLLVLVGGRYGAPTPMARVAAPALAIALGFAVCLPYLRSIASGWDAQHSGLAHSFLHVDWVMPWTLLTSCGLLALAASHGLHRAIGEGRWLGVFLGAWSLGMVLFASVVHLPESNEHKFVWPLAVLLGLLAGPGAEALWGALRRRGAALAWAVAVVVVAAPPAWVLQGYLRDPSGTTDPATAPEPGENELYEWMRAHVDREAVVIEHHSRDLVMVHARRRLLAGTVFGPERAAFPAQSLERRRALSAEWFGPVEHPARAMEALEAEVAAARRRHPVREAWVLYRRRDHQGDQPWDRLLARLPGTSRRYDRDGFVLIQLPLSANP